MPSSCLPESKKNPRLSAIFLLSDADENIKQDMVTIQPIKGVDDLMTMIKQTFLLNINDTSLMAHQFRNLGKLLSSGINVYQLDYPRKHSMLPLVRSRIRSVL